MTFDPRVRAWARASIHEPTPQGVWVSDGPL